MKKTKIPFDFYIDLEGPNVNLELKEKFLTWMLGGYEYSRSYSCSESKFRDDRFVGFCPKDGYPGDTLDTLGTNETRWFERKDIKEVTLQYWSRYIKNKVYKAIENKVDRWDDTYRGGGISEEYNRIVLLTRNKIVRMKYESQAFDSFLNNYNLTCNEENQHTEGWENGNLISVFSIDSSNHGYCLPSEETERSSCGQLPTSIVDYLIANDEVFRCESTGNVSEVEYREDATDSDGEMVTISSYWTTLCESRRYSMIFTSVMAANANGYVHCEVSDDFVKHEDVLPEANARYHRLERRWMCSKQTDFTIGFEVEKEDEDSRNTIGYQSLFDDTSWIKESDSSLDADSGYELVSPVYNLFSKELDNDIDKDHRLYELINAEYSEDCGGHINIGSSIFSPIQLFYGLKGFLPLMYSIWNIRITNNYSEVMKPHEYVRGNRSAIHIKDNVLEIRLVSAVKSVKNLKWRRDLVRIMVKNINKSEMEVLRMMLNTRSLLHKHLRKVYNEEKFMKKANDFVRYAERFNDVKLNDINWDNLNISKSDKTEEGTEED